jgi:hypothetical protein
MRVGGVDRLSMRTRLLLVYYWRPSRLTLYLFFFARQRDYCPTRCCGISCAHSVDGGTVVRTIRWRKMVLMDRS